MSGDVTFASAALGHLCKTSVARVIFDELSARAVRGFVASYDIALVCIGLGWNEQAFEYLSQAYKE
jgi:hypothetical protein